ncbi:MAG: UDP-N-acetylmuramoyl-tripeptide--D-alanyl-D-alanine ligase [Planctomycetes bacterium]|nr:UDP-N-acetylmuramoyl-tripeptide--D-alanyl-D-alanine ligase [Planctomycetota bacterium]
MAQAMGAQIQGALPEAITGLSIDSRTIAPGDAYFSIKGDVHDGHDFVAAALKAGAALAVVERAQRDKFAPDAPLLVVDDVLAGLVELGIASRARLNAHVIAITGSVGKTSTKDLIAALIAPHRTVAASRENYNTEIGMPLEILRAPLGTEVLVLEAAMRGFGQIAELAAICEPDVGVITNIGPVHLEQMGSLEGVAQAKAELLAGLYDGATAVVPSDEPLLEPWLREALEVVTFGPGGDVTFEGSSLRGGSVPDAVPSSHVIVAGGERIELELPFDQAHNLMNTLAAVAAARAVGVTPSGRLDVRFSGLRGERVLLGTGVTVVNDCYNANPLSMRAALDDLTMQSPAGRRVAVLGDMLELGPAEHEHHAEIGAYAAAAGVELLIAVGPRSAAMLGRFGGEAHLAADAAEAAALAVALVEPGDVVLVKASRGVGLEVVAEALAAGRRDEAGGSPAVGEAPDRSEAD